MGIVVPEWSKVHVLDVRRMMPKTNVIGKCFLDNFFFFGINLDGDSAEFVVTFDKLAFQHLLMFGEYSNLSGISFLKVHLLKFTSKR